MVEIRPMCCCESLGRASGRLLILLAIVCAIEPSAVGQQPLEATTAAERRPVIGRADTSSPRATLRSFLAASNEIYDLVRTEGFIDLEVATHRAAAMRIVDCLDVSELPEYSRLHQASEAAVCLKEILDRQQLPPEEEIPDIEAVKSPEGMKEFSRWRVPGTRITIARVEEGPQRHEYLFTPGTVARAADYYEDMKHLPYREGGPNVTPGIHRWFISAPRGPVVAAIIDRLPEWARDQKFGMTLWKWPGLLTVLMLSITLMVATYALQRRVARRTRHQGLFAYCLSILFPVAAILIPIGFKWIVTDVLSLRGTPLYVASFSADLVVLIAVAVVVFGISNRVAEIIIASPSIHPRGLDAQLIRILTKLASLTAVAAIFLEGGRYLGIPLTTLLASAGVGGLAVALAAQDTLKALFGTITLMADKPFRVGDRIILQKYDGVVEDIGLRSTRLRLLTGHQATVPNDELARADIENVGRRPHIRRIADLNIPLETPVELLEQAVEVIRKKLKDHEGMESEFPPRVFFNEINNDSYNIRVIYWYHPPNYWDFLDFSQRLNLDICRALEQRGIRLSLPKRITHTELDGQQPSRP